DEVSLRGRWGLALMIVGWVHLADFLAGQAIYKEDVRGDLRHLALWVLEVVAVVAGVRRLAGKGGWRDSPAASRMVVVWGRFLILTFNSATYNTLTGWGVDWFKASWATLSTFGFATLAWLIDLRFLFLAVQMYFTGLLLIRFPHQSYVIYGVSWCVA